MRVINIDYHESEFSYTEDYDKWKGIISRVIKTAIFPDFLKKYNLQFMTAPTTSFYDTFIISRIRYCTLDQIETILKESARDIIIFYIEKDKDSDKYIFRYGIIDSAGRAKEEFKKGLERKNFAEKIFEGRCLEISLEKF